MLSQHLFRFCSSIFLIVSLTLAIVLKRPSQLTKEYAVCSMSNKIYTMDFAHPNVQCIVMHDTRVVDVGDLGLSPLPSNLQLLFSKTHQWMSRFAGDNDSFLGPLGSLNSGH